MRNVILNADARTAQWDEPWNAESSASHANSAEWSK